MLFGPAQQHRVSGAGGAAATHDEQVVVGTIFMQGYAQFQQRLSVPFMAGPNSLFLLSSRSVSTPSMARCTSASVQARPTGEAGNPNNLLICLSRPRPHSFPPKEPDGGMAAANHSAAAPREREQNHDRT